nr:hypothetical protein [Anaerolineae bacterium]
MDFTQLTREELLKLVDIYAKNWLAHDGSWFLALEEHFGMDTAIEMDRKSWERFSVAEAKRIMREFDIPENGGLEALEQALKWRLYAGINTQESVRVADNVLEFRMIECRVQTTRRRKGLPDFPCKSVGIVEYSQFASTIDPRIKTECLYCPPDPVGEAFCGWRFTLEDGEG